MEAMQKRIDDLAADNAALRLSKMSVSNLQPLPTFSGDGKGMSIDEFRKLLPLRLAANGVPEADHVVNAKSCLTGAALNFVDSNKADLPNTLSLDEFLGYLCTGPWVNEYTPYQLRILCEQAGNDCTNTHSYLRKIATLVSKLDATEHERCCIILRGLPDDLRNMCMLENKEGKFWDSSKPLLNYVQAMGADFKWPKRGGGEFVKVGKGGKRFVPDKPDTGKNGKRPAHFGPAPANTNNPKKPKPYVARDSLSPAEQAQRKAAGECFACGSKEHRANDKDANGRWKCSKHT